MNSFMAKVLKVFGGKGSDDNHLHEASMNFDISNVPEFLEQLNQSLECNLNVPVLVDFTSSVPIEEEGVLETEFSLSGHGEYLKYVVHMDDADSPNLYFFAEHKEISDAIQNEMNRFADNNGL